jgi:two-component system cell cycle response regulator DivK
MPIIDGYEASRRIKANAELRHIPIIAITSFALAGDEEKTAAAGCDGYVPKPCSPRQVLAMVREFLAEKRVPASGSSDSRPTG